MYINKLSQVVVGMNPGRECRLDWGADSLFLPTIVILIILRSFALCAGVASGSGSRHCTIGTVYLDIWYGEKKTIESRLFFRS